MASHRCFAQSSGAEIVGNEETKNFSEKDATFWNMETSIKQTG